MKSLILLLLLFFFHQLAYSQSFQSSDTKVQLLELYSSQGCSSCPPAERWVSELKYHPDLWNKFIPIVFHVDYWNYLGWKDPFSSKKYSDRQRTYYEQRAVKSVYTPGFILDGNDWRGWYRNQAFISTNESKGFLQATLHNNQLSASFTNSKPSILNVALLGFDIKSNILNGENANKTFKEDFIVLSYQSKFSNNGKWSLPVKTQSKFAANRYALAIWVNSERNLKPIQAVGGWIE